MLHIGGWLGWAWVELHIATYLLVVSSGLFLSQEIYFDFSISKELYTNKYKKI